MTNNEHPITPPPKLVERLRSEAPHGIRDAGVTRELHLITAAYRAGADHQFAECFQWVKSHVSTNRARLLRAALRPRPPSLKEQSLDLIDLIQSSTKAWNIRDLDVVRRAFIAMTWQPIDTAPKDGTEILASDYDAIEIVSWVPSAPRSPWPGGWVDRDGAVVYPAWWQPLPDHPPLEGEDTAATPVESV